jgi:hypothetical protein
MTVDRGRRDGPLVEPELRNPLRQRRHEQRAVYASRRFEPGSASCAAPRSQPL